MAQMQTQRLGFVGLEEDTVRACLSMLKIIDSRSSVNWSHTAPALADVLMVSSQQEAQTRQESLSQKPYIVIYPSCEEKPKSAFTLPHPFRVMQLLDVLDDVVRSLDSSLNTATHDRRVSRNAGTPSNERGTSLPSADFCASLYRVINSKGGGELYSSQSPEGLLLVKPGSHRFYARPALLHALSAGPVSFSPLSPSSDPVSEGMVPRPLFELAWLTGASHSSALLPWLEEDSQFRLSRWPSAAALNKSRPLLSLCALMTRRALTLSELKTLSHCDDKVLFHFINACEISGLLISQARSASTVHAIPANSENHRLGGMIKGLRTRLGLG
ncbi:MAG: hypothetical protein ACFE0K_03930 [Alcanivorax sp.]|uniref:hypothetical protein n=1 Tax=Alcanivorax sp. TaxID=1872427 RepID=UPI003DA74972